MSCAHDPDNGILIETARGQHDSEHETSDIPFDDRAAGEAGRESPEPSGQPKEPDATPEGGASASGEEPGVGDRPQESAPSPVDLRGRPSDQEGSGLD